jgi:hypothetical protein
VEANWDLRLEIIKALAFIKEGVIVEVKLDLDGKQTIYRWVSGG